MKKVVINTQQRKELLTGLANGVLCVEVIPELAELFPKTIGWFQWLDELPSLEGEVCKAYIELDRTGKIEILKAIRSGTINLSAFVQVADKEERRERFLELMIQASSKKKEVV